MASLNNNVSDIVNKNNDLNLKMKTDYSNDSLNATEDEGVFSFETKPINDDEMSTKATKASSVKSNGGNEKTEINLMTKSSNSNDLEDSVCTTDSECEGLLEFRPRRNHSTVSQLNDETDNWGEEELVNKEEHYLTLKDSKLKDALMSRLNTFRRNRELCDVTLFVREHEILAHKVVLASISPALFDMFLNEQSSSNKKPNGQIGLNGGSTTNGNVENVNKPSNNTNNSMNYYEFEQADCDCFEAIVNFAYTSKLQISNRKVSDLYKTAYALKVFPIANACARYLAEHLNCKNCIGIRKHANFHNDKYLVEKVDNFITKNFENVIVDSLEFTQLPCIKVRIILESIHCVDNSTGYSLAEKSLAYFQKSPRTFERIDQQIEAFSEKSHLLYLDEDSQLQDCCDMDEQSLVGSCDLVKDYRRLSSNKSSKTVTHHPNSQHRVTGALAVKLNASRVPNAKYASNESLNSVASSGSTNNEDEIESRLIAVNKTSSSLWIALAVFHRRLVAFSIQRLNENNLDTTEAHNKSSRQSARNSRNASPTICINGITTNNNFEPTLPSLDNSNIGNGLNTRVPLQNMAQARCSIGATFLNGRGYDRGECLKSVEEYKIELQEWHPLPEMRTERGRFDSAVVGNMVYAIAGSNGNNDLKSCERYDPQTKTWSEIKALSCATMDNLIYCIGGSSDQVVLKECERYDPATDEWQSIAPMHTARFQVNYKLYNLFLKAACTAWRGLIVTCAGSDKWNCLDTVEAYDPRTDTWRYLAKLKTARRGCAVAVVRDTLYVIGGHDGTNSLASVEVLDHPNGHNWRPGPSLTTARANTHAVVTASQSIYVIGGFNANQFLSSIEVLENEQLGWRSWQVPRNCINKNSIPEEESSVDSELLDEKPEIEGRQQTVA